MDILSPDLFWIADRCYRLSALDSSCSENRKSFEENEWTEPETPFDCDENNFENEEAETLDIETLPNNRFKLCLSISQAFWPKIVGSKGVTKKRIENDTNCTLTIPKPMEHGDVVIKSSSKKNLILAKKNIEAIVLSARQKLFPTHFISIPMTGEEIKKNFINFKDQVLKLCGKDRGVDDSIFQNPCKLHLTLGTLVLTDHNERDSADELLNKVFETSIKPLIANQKLILIEMKGIEFMNDDPSEVDVLYAKINLREGGDIVQRIADCILKNLSLQMLLKSDKREQVKLHVTLMNTIFREEEPDELNVETEGAGRNKLNKKPRRTFNACNILQNFHDYYFGQQELKSIHLSVRFSTAKDGYYRSSCVLNI